MRDLAKEDSNLPGIYSPECEYQLSSIFVDTEMSMDLFAKSSMDDAVVLLIKRYHISVYLNLSCWH
ncbi:hypothetical protein H5410_005622 [Solanum commersonii]|uniref:Uncharacterized protein n=1 Tax=Solanum commersonii TaxID=4109 RepID=A0A9J6A818_SOLCO|nr:hypothetical protein H5410_005622 [Solanum commersonii]